jgi:hypothetical protein
MANRSLAEKRRKAMRQARDAAKAAWWHEASKPDVVSSDLQATALHAALPQMVASFDGAIVRGETVNARGLSRDVGREGKQRRALTTRCYGDGTRGASHDRVMADWSLGYEVQRRSVWPLYRPAG